MAGRVTATLLATVLAAACATGLAAPVRAADTWRAVVIGQSGRGNDDSAFADSFYASDALRASEIGRVTLLRDAPSGTLFEVLSSLSGAENMLIYYAGPLSDGGRSLAMPGGAVGLGDLLQRLAQQGREQVALLIEDCSARAPAPTGLAQLSVPDGLRLFVAASAGPDGSCPPPGARLTDRLSTAKAELAPVGLETLVGGLWTQAALQAPLTLFASARPPAAPAPATVAPVVSIVASDSVSLAPVARPVRSQTAPAGNGSAAPAGEAVVIFAAQPAGAQLAALPRQAGLPEPSIIVGLIQPPDGTFEDAEDTGEVTRNEIAYDDLEARRQMRRSDPGLFERLVASGAFDPPDAVLARALQTELQRMGCYTSSVDGIWGGGSRSSVQRYFDQVQGVTPVSLDPVVELFRQIILKDDVVCATPVAAPRAPARSTAPAPTRNTAPAAPAPAPAQNAPRINLDSLMGGTLR